MERRKSSVGLGLRVDGAAAGTAGGSTGKKDEKVCTKEMNGKPPTPASPPVAVGQFGMRLSEERAVSPLSKP